MLHGFTLNRGYVREAPHPEWGEDWWEECAAAHAGATRCWIVRRRGIR